MPNGSAAAAAAAAAATTSEAPETSGKALNSSAVANSDVKDTAADSVMADVSQTVPADNDQISTEAPASRKSETDAAASPVDKNQQLTEDADQADATISMDVDADKATPEPEAPSAAAQEAAEAAADEIMEAAAEDESTQHPANQQGSEDIAHSQEEGQEAAPPTTDPEKEDEVLAKQSKEQEEAEPLALADPREAAREQAETEMADGKLSMADVDVRIDELKDELAASAKKPDPQTDVESKAKADTKVKAETKAKAESKAKAETKVKAETRAKAETKAEPDQQAGEAEAEEQAEKPEPEKQAVKAEPAQKAEAAHKAEPNAENALKERSPAGPVSSAQGSAERDSRGVKRPAPAIPRGAKQARTNQAAGLRLGLLALLLSDTTDTFAFSGSGGFLATIEFSGTIGVYCCHSEQQLFVMPSECHILLGSHIDHSFSVLKLVRQMQLALHHPDKAEPHMSGSSQMSLYYTNISALLLVGRLLGTIRQQGTVKRTVIRGRVGARPAGMRLPPPMATQDTAPAKAPATSAGAQDKDDAKDKSETTAKEDDKVCASIASPQCRNFLLSPCVSQ